MQNGNFFRTLDSGGLSMIQEISRLRQVGRVRSPYREKAEAPFQGRHRNEESTLEIFEEYEPALLDSEQCSHLFVLYWQDRGDRSVLQSKTPWGPEVHGVFATRSPNRPNPIGLCVVELLERRGRFLRVRGMDALDGSPLIDLKPYSAQVDSVPDAKIGWRTGQDPEPVK
jgi:tRNA-Thr(GGU) m(6)t(6)A37 methyltransferase TsaA